MIFPMININFYYFIIPFFSFAVFIIWQFFGLRVMKTRNYVQVWALGVGVGFSVTTIYHIIGFIQLDDSIPNAVFSLGVNLIISMMGSLLYLIPIQLGVSSQRVRILLELEKSPKGMSYQEILNVYDANDILQARLGRLTNSGQVEFSDEKYYLGKAVSLVIMTKIYDLAALILFGKKNEI